MRRNLWQNAAMTLGLSAALGLAVGTGLLAQEDDAEQEAITVAQVHYAEQDAEDAGCFSDRFLLRVARTTDLPVDTAFEPVELGEQAMFEHPFVVMTGTGALDLSDDERDALQRYLQRGGFILASARCGDEQWAGDFTALIDELSGQEQALEPMEPDHPVFETIYEIDRVLVRDPSHWEQQDQAPLQGLHRDGRLQVLFSPAGLNDSDAMGPDCRCCNGKEILNAPLIKANALGYALTR